VTLTIFARIDHAAGASQLSFASRSDANMSHVLARSDHIFLASGVVAVCAGRTHSGAGWRHSPGSIGMRVSPLQGTSISEAPATGGTPGLRGSVCGGTYDGEGNPSQASALHPLCDICVIKYFCPLLPLSCHVEPLWLPVRFARRRWGNA